MLRGTPNPVARRCLAPACAVLTADVQAISCTSLLRLQQLSSAAMRGVPPRNKRALDRRQEASVEQAYARLEQMYLSKGGYLIPSKEQRRIEASGGSATYGEVTTCGIDSLITQMWHRHADNPLSKQGPVFMDLGSGLGRVVLQMALACGHAFQRYIGLELSSTRLDQSEQVLSWLREELGRDPAAADALACVDFYQEDVTSSAVLAEATHVFMCSTAFGAGACRQVVEQLAASPNFQVGASEPLLDLPSKAHSMPCCLSHMAEHMVAMVDAHASVGNVLHYNLAQVLVTSRELPLQHHLLRLGEFGCEMSWNAAGTAHVYVRRDLQRAPEGLLAHYCCREGICWLPNTRSHPTFAVQEPLEGWRFQLAPVQPVSASMHGPDCDSQ
ncbi:hypothetical protein QJQ45_026906 [Haematococcus lacustris]|nr:hypothetical protein QJQ45_026906 [Haematococcus lacustris]